MTRFQRELNGSLGPFWKKEAEKALKDAREAFDPETDDFGEFMASEFGLEEDYIFDFLG